MSSIEKINLLAADARPVSPVRPALWGMGWALLATAVIGTAFAVRFQLRPDLAEMARLAWFIPHLALTLALAAFAARLAVVSSLPGRRLPAGLGVLVLAWLASWIPAGLGDTGLAFEPGSHCSIAVLALALVPAVALAFALRRLAPTRTALTAQYAALASAAAGALGVELACDVHDVTHLLVYHGGPVLAAAALGALVGGRLLRW